MFSVRPVPDREGTSPAGDQQGLAYFRCHIHPDSLLPKTPPGTLFCLLPIYQETFSLFQTLREDHMQKVLTLTATCLLGILLCASAALADEVRTDHFTLNLPSGWTQPQPVQSAQGATMTILQNAAEQTVVTVAVTPVPLSAKDLAIQTIANMKAAGFTTTEPVAPAIPMWENSPKSRSRASAISVPTASSAASSPSWALPSMPVRRC